MEFLMTNENGVLQERVDRLVKQLLDYTELAAEMLGASPEEVNRAFLELAGMSIASLIQANGWAKDPKQDMEAGSKAAAYIAKVFRECFPEDHFNPLV